MHARTNANIRRGVCAHQRDVVATKSEHDCGHRVEGAKHGPDWSFPFASLVAHNRAWLQRISSGCSNGYAGIAGCNDGTHSADKHEVTKVLDLWWDTDVSAD